MKNIEKVLKIASPEQIRAGKNWYKEAHKFAQELSDKYAISFKRVCGVISALSPCTEWERNKRDAEKLIELYYTGEIFEGYEYSFGTYGRNVLKAIDILTVLDDRTEQFFTGTRYGQKTHSFFQNIFSPASKKYVTIDRHAYSVYAGRKYSAPTNISKKKYEQIADNYIRLAQKHKLRPCELQAITWIAYKQNIKTN